jgi:hypothetical protein
MVSPFLYDHHALQAYTNKKRRHETLLAYLQKRVEIVQMRLQLTGL